MTDKNSLAPWLTALAVVFAIATPAVQAISGWGLGAGAFAADGQSTLRAASDAFSIWSLIYLWLIAYAVYRLLPASRNQIDNALAPSAFIAIAGCGVWIIASSADWKLATVAIIAVSAGVLVQALVKARVEDASRVQAWLIVAPLSLLAGWLTIATAINALTVATAFGLLAGVAAPMAASIGIVLVAIAAIAVARRAGLFIYALPIAWGLAAVVAAEWEEKPFIASLAGVAAVCAVIGALMGLLRSRPELPASKRRTF